MPRSRSRSPRRERKRSKERRRHRRSRSRSPRHRSRSPRRRSRSPRRRSRDGHRSRDKKERKYYDDTEKYIPQNENPQYSESDVIVIDPEDDETAMMKAMGFSSFDTTKGKKVEGNEIYQANIVRKRRYRQYMNRRGGFNRPLDFIA